jgi:hypothetical protein
MSDCVIYISDIILNLAESYYKVRLKSKIQGSQDGDYFFAEKAVKNVLDGTENLAKYDWLLSKEDREFLRQEIRDRHGKFFILYHDIIHDCTKINEILDNGDIREAQEMLEGFCAKAGAEMLLEKDYGR